MKKFLKTATLLAACALSPVAAQASVTVNIDLGIMTTNGSTPLPEGSLYTVVVDKAANGFGSFANISGYTGADSLGLDDVVIAIGGTNNLAFGGELGSVQLALTDIQLAFMPTGNPPAQNPAGLSTGDPLKIVFYDTLYSPATHGTIASLQGGPGEGVKFNAFSTSAWTLPADGSTVGIFEFDDDLAGLFGADPMGISRAALTTSQITPGIAVPTPTALAALIPGMGLLAVGRVVRRRREA